MYSDLQCILTKSQTKRTLTCRKGESTMEAAIKSGKPSTLIYFALSSAPQKMKRNEKIYSMSKANNLLTFKSSKLFLLDTMYAGR